MEYKKIFKSWWFWTLVVVYSLLIDMYNPVGITSFLGCLGFVFGSTIVISMIVSFAWGILQLNKKIKEKFTKR